MNGARRDGTLHHQLMPPHTHRSLGRSGHGTGHAEQQAIYPLTASRVCRVALCFLVAGELV